MNEDDDWNQLIQGIRDGDDQACLDFWQQYGPLIERVAKKNLSMGMRRRVGPETVVSSVCMTFFRRAQRGEFDLPDAGSLANLICIITANKVRRKVRFHLQKKRSIDSELPQEKSGEPVGQHWSSEDEAMTSEEFESILASLPTKDREVLEAWIQGLSKQEIAEKLQCSERTIRRTLNNVEEQLEQMIRSDN